MKRGRQEKTKDGEEERALVLDFNLIIVFIDYFLR